MSSHRFRVTYDVTTPEFAAPGDIAKTGYIGRGGWHTNCGNPETALSLREALELVSPQEDAGRWLSEIDGRQDYRTGAVERRSIHPPDDITLASYASSEAPGSSFDHVWFDPLRRVTTKMDIIIMVIKMLCLQRKNGSRILPSIAITF